MDMITCENLTRKFGDLTAVDQMNLNVGAGELFGFLGPNGAGKTTTIKMLIGLLRPTAGRCRIGGYDVQEQPLLARAVLGYVPDNPFLYEKLTGREFLDFMADLYSVVHADRAGRIDDLLRLFDLQNKGNDLIQGYSRGMRQKIALAGALIHNPKVIFLDEPTVGLDPQGARTMQEILRELCRRGVTVFISTHILSIAERLCDRVAIVNRGKLIAQGTVEDLRAIGNRTALLKTGGPKSLWGIPEHQNTAGHNATPADSPTSNDQRALSHVAASTDARSLEDIFLELTDNGEENDVIRYLG
jgi:ABC-2 type transport system ATP-binding protein